jgi:peptidoglycan/LPS O-acetylase OafA/YrhL
MDDGRQDNMPEQPLQLTRRYDLDWLRVLAVLLLVPYHSAIIFSSLPQTQVVYVYDSQHSLLLMKTVDFMYLWHMPLLFVVAGAASLFALGVRSGRRYLGERVNRLLVPLLFGMVVLLPPTLYLWTRRVPRLAARFPTFFQFYPHYFVPDLGDLTGRTQGSWTPQHLWFILYLLGYSALALPIFQYLRGPSGKRLVEGLAAFFARRGTILLLALPLALASAVPIGGSENPLMYLVWFAYGYLLMSDPRFQAALDRHTLTAFLLAILSTLFIFTVGQKVGPAWSPLWMLWGVVYNFSRWFWVVGILGLGHRFLNTNSAVLRYANEAVYPFYILHYPVNMLAGYLLRPWNATVAVKYAVIVVLTTTVSLALYEALIRRFNLLRFLFGMKRLGAKRPGPASSSVPG